MSPRQKDGLKGCFSQDTPSATGNNVNVVMWVAAWHVDDGFPVPLAPGVTLLDGLCTLKWTATSIREMSVNMVLEDLYACGYKHAWAPRLAGDIKRALVLKDMSDLQADVPSVKVPIQDIPNIKILPNKTFVDYMPPVTATVAEIRTWFHFWFDNRMAEPNFKRFATKFQYQSPGSLVDEIMWDGQALQNLTRQEMKETSLGRHLRCIYFSTLFNDIRAAKKKMHDDMTRSERKALPTNPKKRRRPSD